MEPTPTLIKAPPIARANALIGTALQAPLRGSFLRLVQIAWWSLAVVTVGLFILTIPDRYSQLIIEGAENSIALGDLGLAHTFFAWLIGTLDGIAFLLYTLVGALIFRIKSQEWIGLFASLTLITAIFAIVRPFDSLLFVSAPLQVPMLVIFALAAINVTIFLYIFPDGRFEPRLARWLTLGLCAFIVYGVTDRIWFHFRWPPAPLSPVIFVGIVIGALVQMYRYRRVSNPAQKQQIKWVVLSVAVGAVVLFGYMVVVPGLLPRVHLPGMPRVLYLAIGIPIFYLALMQLPLALAISILRYRLWDIDLIISRTLVYVLLTASLTGLFAALESVTQQLFILATGQQSNIATVISTLVVVAAFTPIKETLQKFAEKRFQDPAKPEEKLKAFTELVEMRVSPLSAPQITRRFLAEAITAFDATGGAAFLDHNGESKLLASVAAWDGEAVFCVPIQNADRGTRYGWVALKDRKNGAPYSDEETQALQSVANQIARALQEDALEDRD